MAIFKVTGRNGRVYRVEAPKGTPNEVIVQALLANHPEAAQPVRKSDIVGEAIGSVKQVGSSLGTALGLFGEDYNRAAQAGAERAQQIREETGEGPSFDAVSRAYEQRGLLGGIQEAAGQIPRALAGQTGNIGLASIAGRIGTSVLGGPLGLGLGALSLVPLFYGQGAERQASEQMDSGAPVDINRGRAFAAAVPSAAAEGVGLYFTLGKNFVRRLLGQDVAALMRKDGQEALVKAAASTLKGMAVRGAFIEMPVEIAQSVMERWQAGLDLGSTEALTEYGEAAYLGGLVGGALGPVGGVGTRSRARDILTEQQMQQPAPGAPTPSAPAGVPAPVTVPTPDEIAQMSWAGAFKLRDKLATVPPSPELNKLKRDLTAHMSALHRAEYEQAQQAKEVQKQAEEERKARGVSSAEESAAVFERAAQGVLLSSENVITAETLDDLSNYGIPIEKPSWKGTYKWLMNNVMGRTPLEVRGMLTRNPDLTKGNGIKARALRMLVDPEARQAFVEQQGVAPPEFDPNAAAAATAEPVVETAAEPVVETAAEPGVAPVEGAVAPEVVPEVTPVEGAVAPEVVPGVAPVEGAVAPEVVPEVAPVEGAVAPEVVPEVVPVEDAVAPEVVPVGDAVAPGVAPVEDAAVSEPVLKKKAPKKEAPKKEAPKKEAPKKEAPKKEAPKKEAPPKVAKAAPQPKVAPKDVWEQLRSSLDPTSSGANVRWSDLDRQAKETWHDTVTGEGAVGGKDSAEARAAQADLLRYHAQILEDLSRRASPRRKPRTPEQSWEFMATAVNWNDLSKDLQKDWEVAEKTQENANKIAARHEGDVFETIRAPGSARKEGVTGTPAPAQERPKGFDAVLQAMNDLVGMDLVSPRARDMLAWFLKANPRLADDLSLEGRARSERAKSDASAQYVAASRTIQLFIDTQGKDSDAVHELMHHLERMMPPDVQEMIMQTWRRELDARRAAATGETKTYFDEMHRAYTEAMDPEARKALRLAAIGRLDRDTDPLPYDLYQFAGPSEFWAVNATRIVEGAYEQIAEKKGEAKPKSLVAKLKQWLGDLAAQVRSLFGKRTPKNLVEALESLAAGDGKFQSDSLLAQNFISRIQGAPVDLKDLPPFAALPPSASATLSQMRPVAKPGAMQMLRQALPSQGGWTANMMADPDSWITKARTRIADTMATLETRFDGAVRDAMGNLSPMLLLRQANDSAKLVLEFYTQGGLRFRPDLNQFEVYKREGGSARHPAEVFGVLDKWAKKNGLSFENARTDAGHILEAVRLRELLKANPKFPSHMTPAQIDELTRIYDEDALLQEISSIMDETRTYMIEWMEASGRLTPQMANDWRSVVGYVPFSRVADLESHFREKRRVGKGLASLGGLPDTIVGSATRDVKNVFTNYVELMGWMLRQTVQNTATQNSLLALEKQGQAKRTSRTSDKNVAYTYIKGKKVSFELPSVYDAMAYATVDAPLPPVFPLLQKVSNTFRTAITAIPTFSAKQIAEDLQRAAALSGVKDVAALVQRGLSNFASLSASELVAPKHPAVTKFGSLGLTGEIDWNAKDPASSLLKDLGYENRKLLGSTLLGKTLHKLDGITRASDLAIRMAIYDQTLAETKDEALALARAREIIDFRRRGSGDPLGLLPMAIQTIPFFNAYIQGLDVTLRGMTGHRAPSGLQARKARAFFYSRVGMLAGITALYAMGREDDEEYKRIPLEERDSMFMLGGGFSLPVATELGVLFKAPIERAWEYFRNGDPIDRSASEAITLYLKDAGFALFGRTVPIPQAIRPLAEIWTNYDFRTGRPLVGTYQQGLEKSRQSTSITSDLAKTIAAYTRDTANVEVSPIAIDTVLKGYFGTTAALATGLGDVVLNPGKTDRPLHRWIGLGPFTYDPTGLRTLTEFNALRDEASKTHKTLLELQKSDPTAVEEYVQNNPIKMQFVAPMNSALTALKNIRAYKKYLESKPAQDAYTPEERRKLLDDARRQEVAIAEFALEAYKHIRKGVQANRQTLTP